MSNEKKKKEISLDDLGDMKNNPMIDFLAKNKKAVAVVLILVVVYIIDLVLTVYNFLN